MGLEQSSFGKYVTLKCRGTVGTSQVNLNPLAVALRWSSIFDIAYLLDLSSSGVNDKGTPTVGTGAQVVRVVGLDGDYNRQIEDVTLNGQTKVTTSKKFLRVFAAYVKTTGSGGANAGDIYILKTGTGGTYTNGVPGTLTSAVIEMLTGNNLGYSGLFTAPRGTAYKLANLLVTARVQSGSVSLILEDPTNSEFKGPFSIYKIEVTTQSGNPPVTPSHVLNEKQDIYVQATATASGGIINAVLEWEQTTGDGSSIIV